MTGAEAYHRIYPKSTTAEWDGPRLLRKSQLQERLGELKRELAETSHFDRVACASGASV
jgi:hypothetical protein